MRLRFAIVVVLFGLMPALSRAQTPPAPASKPTIADVNRVLQGVAADNTKLQTYCDLAKLNQQMAQTDPEKDPKILEDLGAQADRMEESLGPEYAELMIGLEQVDPNSTEGNAIAAAFANIDRMCGAR